MSISLKHFFSLWIFGASLSPIVLLLVFQSTLWWKNSRNNQSEKLNTPSQVCTLRQWDPRELQSSWIHPHPSSTLGHDMSIHHPPETRKLGKCAGLADPSSFAVAWKSKTFLFHVLCPKDFAPSHADFSGFVGTSSISNTGDVINQDWGREVVVIPLPAQFIIKQIMTLQKTEAFSPVPLEMVLHLPLCLFTDWKEVPAG